MKDKENEVLTVYMNNGDVYYVINTESEIKAFLSELYAHTNTYSKKGYVNQELFDRILNQICIIENNFFYFNLSSSRDKIYCVKNDDETNLFIDNSYNN